MRLSRLLIEADPKPLALEFGDGLTVVARVPAPVRDLLVREILDGFASDRTGMHLELQNDRGEHIRVLRPSKGRTRVIDPATNADLTDQNVDGTGLVDLFTSRGLDREATRSLMAPTTGELNSADRLDRQVARLAEMNQAELWSAAARVRITDNELQTLLGDAPGESPNDAVVARVEREHQTLERAVLQQQQIQQALGRVTAFTAILAMPVFLLDHGKSLALLAIAGVLLAFTLLYRARVAAAKRAESSALSDAGSSSYLGFVVQRVDTMNDDVEHSRRRSIAAEDHRAAAIAWTQLVGDIRVGWALEHQHEIEAAARLNREMNALGRGSATAPTVDDATASLAQNLVARLAELRSMGREQESFPLLLDDPLVDVDPSTRSALLELLARAAHNQQVVVFTDQDDVAEWARLETLDGHVSLVEALPRADAEDDGDSVDTETDLTDSASPDHVAV